MEDKQIDFMGLLATMRKNDEARTAIKPTFDEVASRVHDKLTDFILENDLEEKVHDIGGITYSDYGFDPCIRQMERDYLRNPSQDIGSLEYLESDFTLCYE